MKPEWILVAVALIQIASTGYSWYNSAKLLQKIDELKDWMEERYLRKELADARNSETQWKFGEIQRRLSELEKKRSHTA